MYLLSWPSISCSSSYSSVHWGHCHSSESQLPCSSGPDLSLYPHTYNNARVKTLGLQLGQRSLTFSDRVGPFRIKHFPLAIGCFVRPFEHARFWTLLNLVISWENTLWVSSSIHELTRPSEIELFNPVFFFKIQIFRIFFTTAPGSISIFWEVMDY